MTKRIVKLRIEDFETGYADRPNFKYVSTTLVNTEISDIIEQAYRKWVDHGDGSQQLRRVMTLIGEEVSSPLMPTFSFKTYKLIRKVPKSHPHEWILVNEAEGHEYCIVCDIDNCVECDETTCEVTSDNFCCYHNGDIEKHKMCSDCMDWLRN